MAIITAFAMLFGSAHSAYSSLHFNPDIYVRNGYIVDAESYSWMVRVNACGGVLISKDTILTAEHCVSNDTSLEQSVIFAGIHRGKSELSRRINEICVIGKHLDTVMAKIERVDGVEAMYIPDVEPNYESAPQVSVLGWGIVDDSSAPMGSHLRKGEVPVVGAERCASYYLSLAAESFCTRNGLYDAQPCSGDSGGPALFAMPPYKIGEIGVFQATGACYSRPNVDLPRFSRIVPMRDGIMDYATKGDRGICAR